MVQINPEDLPRLKNVLQAPRMSGDDIMDFVNSAGRDLALRLFLEAVFRASELEAVILERSVQSHVQEILRAVNVAALEVSLKERSRITSEIEGADFATALVGARMLEDKDALETVREEVLGEKLEVYFACTCLLEALYKAAMTRLMIKSDHPQNLHQFVVRTVLERL